MVFISSVEFLNVVVKLTNKNVNGLTEMSEFILKKTRENEIWNYEMFLN